MGAKAYASLSMLRTRVWLLLACALAFLWSMVAWQYRQSDRSRLPAVSTVFHPN